MRNIMYTKNIITIILVTLGFIMNSCDSEFLEPSDDNHSSSERLVNDPGFAEGLLIRAYRSLPNGYSLDEVATDDAVTNVDGQNYRRMATGEWSSRFNPMNIWSGANGSYAMIHYLNRFLKVNQNAQYAWDDANGPVQARIDAFRRRYEGEALILRAWYNFELLKRHGGISKDGTPTEFIIIGENPSKDTCFYLYRKRNK